MLVYTINTTAYNIYQKDHCLYYAGIYYNYNFSLLVYFLLFLETFYKPLFSPQSKCIFLQKYLQLVGGSQNSMGSACLRCWRERTTRGAHQICHEIRFSSSFLCTQKTQENTMWKIIKNKSKKSKLRKGNKWERQTDRRRDRQKGDRKTDRQWAVQMGEIDMRQGQTAEGI